MTLQMKFEIANYTADTFAPYVGQVLVFDPGGVQLELLKVSRRNTGQVPAGFREPFALLFALRSAEPLGRDPRFAYYEAVFG